MHDVPLRTPPYRLEAIKNAKHRKSKFMFGFNHITFSNPSRKNIFLSFYQNSWFSLPVPSRKEGRFAVVTNVDAGCGGRVDVAAWGNPAPTNGSDAHGQVAWS
ncbi:hypothetical protein SSBR45G_29990 [Bradyrhizobium sp. SSBR45G]|uniref:hypothetical protein n=1 Tax=unclassified Bradyrhizobium TaxID=2631580 RepID=UPI0023428C44|nr:MULTISPECIES: hypothetical protein [unclassified Bradyrhizobium]GLH78091.1 hypothetical protein SSBR45G_29990 [Bradyrhizobium sp. SSBR45G]GLH87989.1 hypothetical protein SSBR45R_54490 [Bradyrhizobium sp. SSBR45R]